MTDDDERALRAEQRRARAVLLKLEGADEQADVCPVRGPDAFFLVAELTRQAWALADFKLPRYERKEIPITFVRGSSRD